MAYICDHLGYLKTLPSEYFNKSNYFNNEQKKKICSRKTSMNSYEIRYGAIDLQSYYFHTQSREFCNSLQKGQGLTVSTFLSRIFDWDEIAQGSNKKNYFLHKEILPKILWKLTHPDKPDRSTEPLLSGRKAHPEVIHWIG